MTQATDHQISLLHHTLGLRPDRREPFRNHFVAGPGHDDMPALESLEGMGLMARSPTPSFCEPGDVVFHVTPAGRALALEMLELPAPRPKLTRYSEFLDADGGWSFGEFLCGARLPQFEIRSSLGRAAQYRMFRTVSDGDYGRYRDVQGEWANTKKEAKASYKAALKARQEELFSNVCLG